jgi:hypothetical protein
MQLSQLIDQISQDLNDPHGVTWPRDSIKAWLDEAFTLVARYQPAIFNQLQVLTLEPQAEAYDVCPCLRLTYDSVLGQSTESGRVIAPLRPRSDDITLRWQGASCAPERSSPLRLREFSITADGKQLKVFPKVTEKVYVAVRCQVIPSSDDDEVPAEGVAAAVQWVLYRAKAMDEENNPLIVQTAYDHKENFFLFVGQTLRGRSKTTNANNSNTSKNPAS